MADIVVSDLPAKTALLDSDFVIIDDGKQTYKVTGKQLREFLKVNFLSIGTVVYSQSNLMVDNPGRLPLFSGEYIANASTLYPDFYAWVKSHPELCKTKTQYEEALSAYGECPYYVADEAEGSLRLPKLVHYIKNADEANGITQSKAGLPTVKTISNTAAANVPDLASLPSYAKPVQNTQGYSLMTGQSISDSASLAYVENDASLNSSVYGASDTVTPAHTTLYPWVCAYNAAVPASTVQAAEFTGALSGKANTDLSNVLANIDYVVESKVPTESDPSWYRKYKSGWLEQGGLVASTSGATGTVQTLLKPFANANYTLTATARGTFDRTFLITSKTATTFSCAYSSSAVGAYDWRAEGLGAN